MSHEHEQKIKTEMGLVKKPRYTLSDLIYEQISKRRAWVVIQALLCTSESEIRSVMSDSL